MALRIKQKKQDREIDRQHPSYMAGEVRTWADDERDKTRGSFRRNFIAIIAVIVLIAIVLIVAAVSAVLPAFNQQQIDAADTFAISQYEKQQMETSAETFAKGVMVFAYCSDPDTAIAGKQTALNEMANNTPSYSEIYNLTQVNPIIAPENFAAIATNLTPDTSTQAYAGKYTYELNAVAADTSVTAGGENGTFADRGYHMKLVFDMVKDDTTGQNKWVISNAIITPNYDPVF